MIIIFNVYILYLMYINRLIVFQLSLLDPLLVIVNVTLSIDVICHVSKFR